MFLERRVQVGSGRQRAWPMGASRLPRESQLRLEMHNRGFPEPELNMDIVEEGGWIGEGRLRVAAVPHDR